jgi:hypothetical protein
MLGEGRQTLLWTISIVPTPLRLIIRSFGYDRGFWEGALLFLAMVVNIIGSAQTISIRVMD